MRRGTSSLGTDVPSEREINRLAARSDEEFWLFEKMDEERRKKENYRTRLMEEHEVPEWAYAYAAPSKEDKMKGFDSGVTGKRKRKEVVYADTLSDLQWMKAVENGEDVLKLRGRAKKRDHLPANSNSPATENIEAEERLSELRNESAPMAGDSTSEDTFHVTPASKRHKTEGMNTHKHDYGGVSGSGLNEHVFSWNTYRKRSSYLVQGPSSDSRGQNSSGRGN